jgi:hypothetical protein
MGSTSAVDIDKDGKSVWVAERCGANSCLDRATGQIKNVDTVLKFDTAGNVLKSFGAGMFIAPHGIMSNNSSASAIHFCVVMTTAGR